MAELSIDFTCDELIKVVKSLQTVPTSQGVFDEDDFVRKLNVQMLTKVVPAIVSANEEYFVTFSDVALVANQAAYNIPSRALGSTLRDVTYVDANGGESPLPRQSPESVKNVGGFYGCIIRGSTIIIFPTPTVSQGFMRFYYERRPNNLCKKSASSNIASFSAVTPSITVDAKPAAWVAGTKLDFISPNPPFDVVAEGVTVLSLTLPNTLVLTSFPTGTATGLFVAPAGFSPVPQLPYEGHLVTAQFTAAASMRSLSNKAPANDAEEQGEKMLKAFIKTLNPRIDGEAKRFGWTGRGIFSGADTGWSMTVGP